MKTPDSLKLDLRAAELLRALLADVPVLRHVDVRLAVDSAASGVDVIGDVQCGNQRHTLLCLAQAASQPRHVRAALMRLRDQVSRTREHVVPVLIVPWLSEAARSLCRDEGVAFLDFEGNACLRFGTVFVDRRVAGKPRAEQRPLRSLFKPKAARVLTVLMRDVSRNWRVADLAAEAGVSLGHVSNVRTRLIDLEWGESTARGMVLTAPDTLLDAWQHAPAMPMGRTERFRSALRGVTLDRALRKVLSDRHASGTVLVASFSAAQVLLGDTGTALPTWHLVADAAGLARLQSALQLQATTGPAEVEVVVHGRGGLLPDAVSKIAGKACTGALQTWLDLIAAGRPGRDMAERIRRELLSSHTAAQMSAPSGSADVVKGRSIRVRDNGNGRGTSR